MTDPLELTFTVECSPRHAFTVWAQRTSQWWPSGHSVSKDPKLSVTFEPRVGGRIFERTPAGAEHEWGEVLAWEPPTRLAYRWHLAQDPGDATEVEVSFTAAAGGTRVTIVHRGWERLGSRGDGLRERNQRGWGGLVPHYRRAATAT